MFKSFRFAALVAGVSFAAVVAAQSPPGGQDGSGDPGYADQGAPADQGPGDQGQPDQGQPVDPPSRVARLALLSGQVSFVPAGENDWVEAQMNRPLVTGDKLWTDRNARAELEIGPAVLRIDQQSSFDFLNLDDNTAQVELTQGTLNLRVRRLYDNQVYEVDTPTLAFVINRVGDYRIDVQPNGTTTVVTARQGGGDAYGEGGARFRVEEGQSITFNDPQLHDYVSNNLPRPDDFDNFSLQRDSRFDRSPTRQYVAEDVIGYSDLDDNGNWSDVPEYGHVWYPTTVAADWTPYHYGHWGWVGAYGWTWIDDASWGFAPFHYGRWAYVGNRWGWCPGPREVRPYYAPALVAFVGGGVGVGFAVGGPVGWFPLGPRDVWVPGYRVSERYFTRSNFANSRMNQTVINNYYGNYRSGHFDYSRVNYANRGIAGATVAVPAAAFVGARPVAASAIAVNRETFGNARVSGFAAIAPTRASLVSANAHAGIAPPASIANRNIVAATRPPAPVASFAQHQAILQKNPGQPLSVNQLHTGNVAGATTIKGGLPAVQSAGRSNVNVVTAGGLPAVQRANTLNGVQKGGPITNSVNGTQHGPITNSTNPSLNRAVTNSAIQTNNAQTINGKPAVSGQHLDSARFTHPNGQTGPATGNNTAQSVNGQTQNLRSVNGVNNVQRGNNVTTGVQNQAHTVGPGASTGTNNNVIKSPNSTNVMKSNVTNTNNAQTYHAPTTTNHTPEYRAPTGSQNLTHEYHPTGQNGQQSVQHVQTQTNYQAKIVAPNNGQPHVASPPPPKEKVERNKDDDKKHR